MKQEDVFNFQYNDIMCLQQSLDNEPMLKGYFDRQAAEIAKEFPLLFQICKAYANLEAVASWYGDASPWK